MISEDVQYEIQVTNAYKSYGEKKVFNGLNLKVRSGSIYGLLGSSGCGKSTLLQCILGTMTLDYGTIDLKTERLKNIGYMPQDLCLEESLTINETFEYYGTLYKMSKRSIETRKDDLNTFLQLPYMDSYVRDLSGGQSRRVSLAISLLHDPKLIILDEPTVGIDPVLRQEIWAEFIKMVVENKKTIIITTHYIEEANQANCIGLMRNGVIVEEESPQEILIKYNTDSLESAFLTLCYDQDKNKSYTPQNFRKKEYVSKSRKLTEPDNNIDFHRIKALFKKYFYVYSRDYLFLFSVILLPILQIFNFCIGIGVDFKNLSIAFKNDEVNYEYCQNYNIKGCIFNDKYNETMSCVVLNYFLSHNYKLIEVKDQDVDERIMTHDKNMAFIHFKKNYTESLIKYIDDRENFDAESSTYIHLTKENLLFRNQITMDIFRSFNHLINKTLSNCYINPRTINMPIEFNSVFGNGVKTYGNGIAALFISMVGFYFPSVFAVSIMSSEKMDGVLSRSMFAGVKLMELLISMFFMCTVVYLAQIFFICLIAYVFFANPILITPGLLLYALVLLLCGWMGFFFGIFTAVIMSTKLSCTYIITGLSLSQFLLSGAIWPLEGQPYLLRAISKLIPMRLVGNTMNNIALKGWSLDHPSIIIGISLTFIYNILLVFVLIVLGKFKKNWWVIQK